MRSSPPPRFAYATLGLLFVNISVGGTLTHFAAPPVLMVASAWGWDTPYMLSHFGWIAVIGILICNTLYFLLFRTEFATLQPSAWRCGRRCRPAGLPSRSGSRPSTCSSWPRRSTIVHHPALLVGGFLFFLAFFEVTEDYQANLPAALADPGRVLPGRPGDPRRAPAVVDRARCWARLSEVPLMLSAIGADRFQRQCRHHLPVDPGAEPDRVDEVRRQWPGRSSAAG